MLAQQGRQAFITKLMLDALLFEISLDSVDSVYDIAGKQCSLEGTKSSWLNGCFFVQTAVQTLDAEKQVWDLPILQPLTGNTSRLDSNRRERPDSTSGMVVAGLSCGPPFPTYTHLPNLKSQGCHKSFSHQCCTLKPPLPLRNAYGGCKAEAG